MSEATPDHDDLLADLANEIAMQWPNLPQSEIDTLVKTMRDRWGGSRPYIQKGLSVLIRERCASIQAAYKRGQRIDQIAAAHQCSRSQVERALGWKK